MERSPGRGWSGAQVEDGAEPHRVHGTQPIVTIMFVLNGLRRVGENKEIVLINEGGETVNGECVNKDDAPGANWNAEADGEEASDLVNEL